MSRSFRYLLLSVLLLAGQWAVLVHATDLAAHPADHPCEVCLHASPLDSGVVTSSVAITPIVLTEIAVEDIAILRPIERHEAFLARGPPALLSA